MTQAERLGLIVGAAGLFLIAIITVIGIIVLAALKQDVPPALPTLGGVAITGGINALGKIGAERNPE